MEWIVVFILVLAFSSLFNSKKDSTERSGFVKKDDMKLNKKLNKEKEEIEKIKLGEEQKIVFERLENSTDNIFITGKAGTGKSVLLKYFKHKSSKRMVVVSFTGVAALNVGGQTINSLFKIPPQFIKKDSLKVNYRTATLLRNIDAVVIDEVSMVRADLMDAMDSLLRQARGNDLPFGGVQIITFGDLYQLSPIVSDPELHKYFVANHGGFYFFNAHVSDKDFFKIYELTTNFRQKDKVFKKILNGIRDGSITNESLNKLNKRVSTDIPKEGVIFLTTTNQAVNEINHSRLAELRGKVHKYKATISGDLSPSAFPTEEILYLKKGAQVMLLRNDREKRWVNGTLGKIHSLSDNNIKVDIDGFVYSIPQTTWNKIRYYYDSKAKTVEEEVMSSFIQFPLRLAWAVTVHKSQGQTYNFIAVDMGSGAFAHGQTYVALSRCTSLKGLYLTQKIKREDIIVDSEVIEFMKRAEILPIKKRKKFAKIV